MKRSIKKQVWLNRNEAQVLKRKAKKACITESALIRMLISEYRPSEISEEDFRNFSNRIDRISKQLSEMSQNRSDTNISKIVEELHVFQADVYEKLYIGEGK